MPDGVLCHLQFSGDNQTTTDGTRHREESHGSQHKILITGSPFYTKNNAHSMLNTGGVPRYDVFKASKTISVYNTNYAF